MSWEDILKEDKIDIKASIKAAKIYLDEMEGWVGYFYRHIVPDDKEFLRSSIVNDTKKMAVLLKNPTPSNLNTIEEMSSDLYSLIDSEDAPLENIPSFDVVYLGSD